MRDYISIYGEKIFLRRLEAKDPKVLASLLRTDAAYKQALNRLVDIDARMM